MEALERVLLVGQGIWSILGPDNIAALKATYTRANYKLIDLDTGVGRKEWEIAKWCDAKRIDIVAHGFLFLGLHGLDLDQNPSFTDSLFTELQFCNKPLHVHLWSCYGGAAAREVVYLPEGSALVTHGREDSETIAELAGFTLRHIVEKELLPYSAFQSFLDHLPLYIMGGVQFSLNLHGAPRHFHPSFDTATLFADPALVISEIQKEFIQFYEAYFEIRQKECYKTQALENRSSLYEANFSAMVTLFLNPALLISEIQKEFIQFYEAYFEIRKKACYQIQVLENMGSLYEANFAEETYNHLRIGYFMDLCGIATNTDILESIKNHYDLTEIINQSINGRTALEAAISSNSRATAWLLDHGADPNQGSVAPLCVAIIYGNAQAVTLLLDAGAEIDQQRENLTPLWFALAKEDVLLVKLLLEAGANPNFVTKTSSPLSTAAEIGYVEIVKLLLAYGANPNFVAEAGSSLSMAAEKGHIEVVKLLLAYGAKQTILGPRGQTPLHYAASKGDQKIVELLVKCGADAHQTVTLGQWEMTPVVLAEAMHHDLTVHYLQKVMDGTITYTPDDCAALLEGYGPEMEAPLLQHAQPEF